MRTLLAFICCFSILLFISTPVFATEQSSVVFSQEIDLGNGITIIDEITEHSQTRTTAKVYKRSNTFKDGDIVIAVIAFQATFHYDGTTVSVASKTVTQTDTYKGWSYNQNSFTSSGGTVTLKGKLSKWLIFNNSFTMSLSCDKDGNISY